MPDPRTIPAVLEEAASTWPDLVAVADGSVRLSFAALHHRVGEAARALAAWGVQPGDRVAVLAPNTWQWVVTAYAVWTAGAVVVPLNSRLRGYEVGEAIEQTQARALVTVGGFVGRDHLAELRESWGGAGDATGSPVRGLPELELVVLHDADAGDGHPRVLGWTPFAAAGERLGGAAVERQPVRPDDLAEILFTSGTTGVPKGVMLDHAQLVRAYDDWSRLGGLRAGDVFLVIAPFSHGFGINAGILAGSLRGMTIVPMAVFDPRVALERIEEQRVSVASGPPNLFSRLLEEPAFATADCSSLRVAFLGAASVPATLIEALQDVGLERVINAYGLIEGTVVTMTRADDPSEVIATTAGRPVPDVELRIVDDTGNDVTTGEPGEVLVRSYGVMRGYWGDEAATRATLDTEGWLRTGDIGVLDERGNLRLVDRKKDMFIVGGFNAYPAEIERLLLRNPAIAQAAVVGVPHPQLGESGWAFIVPAAVARPDEASLRSWARARMANYKVPHGFTVLDELPLNPNGKVDKAALRRIAVASRG